MRLSRRQCRIVRFRIPRRDLNQIQRSAVLHVSDFGRCSGLAARDTEDTAGWLPATPDPLDFDEFGFYFGFLNGRICSMNSSRKPGGTDQGPGSVPVREGGTPYAPGPREDPF